MMETNYYSETDYDYLIQILMIGDASTGKTSLLTRYSENSFNDMVVPNVGVDWKSKKICLNDKRVKIQIVRNIFYFFIIVGYSWTRKICIYYGKLLQNGKCSFCCF